jgi:probable biosynthetic protein (TIGR04098 family)
MDSIIQIIQSVEESFNSDMIDLPIDDIGIDSLGLIELRVEVEKHINNEFPEDVWNNFKTIKELISYCEQWSNEFEYKINEFKNFEIEKTIFINLPQMANNALSENWLFKELGGCHWELLSKGLGKISRDIKDISGNRLYGTFVRIRIQCSPLIHYRENDIFNIKGKIYRYGRNNFLCNLDCESNGKIINAELMTTFSRKSGTDNHNLEPGVPNKENMIIEELSQRPELLTGHRSMVKGLQNTYSFNNEEISLNKNNIFNVDYNINPYQDINGVGLLYFASYPTISDYCELEYFNSINEVKEWSNEYHTVFRDIYYYANCNINDKIIFIINNFEFVNNKKVKIYSSLIRKNDNTQMADIFTIKEKMTE